ncbi:MAG: PQQ-binding-like beta-propeller repeat protein [Polyangiaceae bacterium]|nr:PQQ-binding-like beta-propeller repeat protein [Polyangiaceae bacterium]
MSPSSFRSPARVFRHPLWQTSLVALLVNDHLLKGAGILPGWVTGKLSDFAGLVVAPALLAWILRARSRSVWIAAHVAVGVGFALLEWSPAARSVEALTSALGFPWRLTCDWTDLLALASLFVSFRIAEERGTERSAVQRSRVRAGELLLGGAGLLASIATSKAQEPVVLRSPADARVEEVTQGVSNSMLGLGPASSLRGNDLYFVGSESIVDVRTAKSRKFPEASKSVIGASAPIASSDGTVLFAVRDDGNVRYAAVDSESGAPLWDDKIAAYELPVGAGPVFVFVEGTEIVARTARTGDVAWRQEQPTAILRMAADGDRVYLAEVGDSVIVLDAVTGKREAKLVATGHASVSHPAVATLAVADGMVAVLGPGGLQVADASSEHRWSASADIRPFDKQPGESRAPNGATQVFATGGAVVLWEQGRTLTGFDARSGKKLWSRAAGSINAVSADAGRVAISEDRIAVVDVRTGATVLLADPSARSAKLVDEGSAVRLEK